MDWQTEVLVLKDTVGECCRSVNVMHRFLKSFLNNTAAEPSSYSNCQSCTFDLVSDSSR